MANDPIYERFGYVTYEDIKKLNEGDDKSTLLAIRAPKGSTLELLEPEECAEGNYQIQINSEKD